MAVVIKKLSGGLDKNSNMTSVAPNNYLDAMDITDKNPKGGLDNVKQLNNNADYAFQLPSFSNGRNKRYRISVTNISTSGVAERHLYFHIGLGQLKYGIVDVIFYESDDINTVFSAIETAFTDIATLGAIFPTITLNGDTVTFDIELQYTDGDYNFMDYNISITDDGVISNGGSYTTNVLWDAISGEKAGNLLPSKYSNLGNELFVFSTTATKEPIDTTVTIGFNSGLGFTEIVFPPEITGIEDGLEVFISGEGNGGVKISAYFIVRHYTSGEYYIQNPSNPVDGIPLFDLPYTSFAVKLYQRSLSEIGRAIKNDVSGVWTYTTLVDSINLNFRLYKQIRDAIITPTDLGVNFDWTDKLNPIRRMLYMGDWMTNGFLTIYNPQGLFDLDTIGEESRLQLRQNTSKVTLTPVKTGGNKVEASYVAFVRFGRKSDGVLTTWSHVSNNAWVHSNDLYAHNYGNSTLMSLQILVEQIPLNEFDTAQIGIIEYDSNSYKGYILPEVNINGLTEVTVIDTGEDTSVYIAFPTAEIEQVLQCFDNAANLLDFDNYVIASDVELSLPYDLSDFAQTITLTIETRDIRANNDYSTYANSLWLENTYNNVDYMTTYWTSFMPTEWVRVALVIDWENGAPTSYFWIGDIQINPTTGLRPTDNGTTTINIYQHYLQATNIDTNYLLPDGKYVRDVVKDIRFAIAPIKKEVLATGVAVSTYVDSLPATLPYKINGQYFEGFSTSYTYPQYNTWMFYSPDFINNGQTVQLNSGDVVSSYGLGEQNLFYVDGSPYCVAMDYNSDSGISAVEDILVTNLQTISSGQNGDIIDLRTSNPYSSIDLSTSLGGVSFQTASDLQSKNIVGIYYIRRLNGGNSPYTEDLKTQRYYIVPQDVWYDKASHDSSTPYSIFGGDCFPQKSYYRTINDTTHAVADKYAALSGFYSYNRTNSGLRGGSFPTPNVSDFLTGGSTYADYYTYDSCFTPRHNFQIGTNYNADAMYIDKTIATIYYSGKRLNNALFGNNRIWKFADNGVLENRYGRITDMSILLGTSGNNAILIKQERGVTLQYFNNTGRLVSTSIDVLLGTGDILGTKGTFLSVGGMANKFSRAVCISPISGKEFDIWFDAFNQTINRFGADGSRVISDSISSFLIQHTTLFKPSEYNNLDTPAKDYGVLGVWDNQKKEYAITFRGVAKHTTYDSGTTYGLGDVVTDGNTFGFEEFPVLFKSKIDNNTQPYNDDTVWLRCDSYIDDCHQCFTLVWNELDNVWKGFYSYLPKVYGNVSNNFVSTLSYYTYEHNQDNNARYYCRVKNLGGENGFTITNQTDYFLISSDNNADDMGTWFNILSYPFTTDELLLNHIGYFIYLPTQNKYVRIVEYIDAYNVKVSIDEPITIGTEAELYYTTCNVSQPYIECVVNEGYPRYFNWAATEFNIDKPPYRLEVEAGVDSLGQVTTQSYNNRDEFDYFQGVAHVQIKNDTTNGNENTQGIQGVEGYWCKEKIIFTPNVENKLISHNTIIVEQNKKQK